MSRTEYMRELDALLHGISKEEREEAMQYYNDYFDDDDFDSFDDYNIKKEKRKKGDTFEMDFIDLD